MLETVAAAWWLRRRVPDLRVRVVSVVDLIRLVPVAYHPQGMMNEEFGELFTVDKPVVFAFHGYRRAIHEIVQGHPDADRIHVRGFNEQGTTTTPFQMCVLHKVSRFHLAVEEIRRVPRLREHAPELIAARQARIAESPSRTRTTSWRTSPRIRDGAWTDRAGLRLHWREPGHKRWGTRSSQVRERSPQW